MKEVALSGVEEELSKYLRMAEEGPVLITRDDRPAGVLIGFETDDDWADYLLESDPRFLRLVAEARRSISEEKGLTSNPLPSTRPARSVGPVGRATWTRCALDASVHTEMRVYG